jgi:hypothetical protein
MPGTITRKAQDIEERFAQYERAKVAENAVLIPGEKRGAVPRHIVFTISPGHQAELVKRACDTVILNDLGQIARDKGEWKPDIYFDLIREEYRNCLKVSGLIGGVSFYHDARVRHPDTGMTGAEAKHLITREAKAWGNMKDEDPAWKIYDHIRKQESPVRYYYFSPHFHTMAFGRLIDIQDFEKLCPGWTYHNKKEASNPGGLARYLMSHVAMVPDRKSISWFGRLSAKILGKTELRVYEEPQVDKETGLPWIITESILPSEIGSQYTVTVTEWKSFFRTDHQQRRDPDKIRFPKTGKRSCAPRGVHDKGIDNLWKYDDWEGRL